MYQDSVEEFNKPLIPIVVGILFFHHDKFL